MNYDTEADRNGRGAPARTLPGRVRRLPGTTGVQPGGRSGPCRRSRGIRSARRGGCGFHFGTSGLGAPPALVLACPSRRSPVLSRRRWKTPHQDNSRGKPSRPFVVRFGAGDGLPSFRRLVRVLAAGAALAYKRGDGRGCHPAHVLIAGRPAVYAHHTQNRSGCNYEPASPVPNTAVHQGTLPKLGSPS